MTAELHFESALTIGVASPAGRVAPEVLNSGRAALEKAGARVVVSPHAGGVYSGTGYDFSGTPRERMSDLVSTWMDPAVEVLLCGRGGFGCVQLLPGLPWERFAERPLPVAGYSDITALHFAMLAKGVGVPVSGPMLKQLANADAFTAEQFCGAIVRRPRRIGALSPLRPGSAEGLPVVGNLTVAASLCGTGFLPGTSGKIVILEEIDEASYRIQRCLAQLQLAGFFQGCAGICFGHFTGCPGAEAAIAEFARTQKVPVWTGVPFGHTDPIATIAADERLRVDADGTLFSLGR